MTGRERAVIGQEDVAVLYSAAMRAWNCAE
jgi:hypothetical protein